MTSEDKIQQEIYMWFNNNYCSKLSKPQCIIFSVPNGGQRNKIEAVKLKATGLLSGVSDLIIIGSGVVLFVEVKKIDGKQSPNQIEFENKVNALGHNYFLVRSLAEFQNLITKLQGFNLNL